MERRLNPIDTLAITELLGLQTFRRGPRRAWTKEEDLRLVRRISELYPQTASQLRPQDIDWDQVADVFGGGRKGKDCKKRWTLSLDPTLRRGKWTPHEDQRLLELYAKHGPQWQQVALEIDGRTEHQCSKRYLEVLDPALRNRLKLWTTAEDLLLIRKVKEHGTKWKTIARAFDARPLLNCRNRWRNLLTAVARGRAEQAVTSAMALVVDGDFQQKLFQQDDDMELDEPQEPLPQNINHNNSQQPSTLPELLLLLNHQHKLHRDHQEWTFQFSRDGPGTGPLELLERSGGHISLEELVHYLVQYALAFNLHIAVHQHIHHHYGEDGLFLLPSTTPLPDSRLVDSESQAHRLQHFNYLPPLTEVPRLSLLATLPKDPPPQIHHHYYRPAERSSYKTSYKDSYTDNEVYKKPAQEPYREFRELEYRLDAQAKENDLLRLLNKTDKKEPEIKSEEDSLTPLTQAVQMVQAAEDPLYGKRPADQPDPEKRPKVSYYKNDLFKSDKQNDKQFEQTAEQLIDEDDEDLLQGYGLFYNSVPRDTQPQQDQEFMDLNPFAFPFNPS